MFFTFTKTEVNFNCRSGSRHESGSDLGNKRKKTAKMLLALVVIFFLTNFPVHMFNVIM